MRGLELTNFRKVSYFGCSENFRILILSILYIVQLGLLKLIPSYTVVSRKVVLQKRKSLCGMPKGIMTIMCSAVARLHCTTEASRGIAYLSRNSCKQQDIDRVVKINYSFDVRCPCAQRSFFDVLFLRLPKTEHTATVKYAIHSLNANYQFVTFLRLITISNIVRLDKLCFLMSEDTLRYATATKEQT